MTCLVYCILRDRVLPPELLPVGVDGKKVSLLHDDGLAAAFSLVDDACDTTELSRVKVYAAVIEALHRACTVLPMRYGCLLPSEAHLAALLRERREEFLVRLDEVQGCVEMTIRILLEPVRTRTSHHGSSDDLAARSPGIAHLAALKRRYAAMDTTSQAADALAEKCIAAFEGFFVNYRAEYSPAAHSIFHAPTLSLYFLVRTGCQEQFCEVFQNLELAKTAKMLLSGPWSPYNFVGPASTPKGGSVSHGAGMPGPSFLGQRPGGVELFP